VSLETGLAVSCTARAICTRSYNYEVCRHQIFCVTRASEVERQKEDKPKSPKCIFTSKKWRSAHLKMSTPSSPSSSSSAASATSTGSSSKEDVNEKFARLSGKDKVDFILNPEVWTDFFQVPCLKHSELSIITSLVPL
jgi:hypothetical protein